MEYLKFFNTCRELPLSRICRAWRDWLRFIYYNLNGTEEECNEYNEEKHKNKKRFGKLIPNLFSFYFK